MKKPNFCAIFATMFVAATVITLASCSQDEEYYEDGLFTRADEMMTRSGEQGGSTPTPPTISTLIPEEGQSQTLKFDFVSQNPLYVDSLPTFSSNIDVEMFRTDKSIGVEMIEYSQPFYIAYPSPAAAKIELIETSLVVENVRFEVDSPFLDRYRLRASARILRWDRYYDQNTDWQDDWMDNETSNFEQDCLSYIGEVSNRIFY